MGVDKIEKFLLGKSAWLDKKISANNRVLAVNSSVKSYETVLISGKNVPLIIGGISAIKDGAVCVKGLAQLQKVLCDNFGSAFMSRVIAVSDSCGFSVCTVKFRSYKARWGCCDSSKNIVFNYKILMLPEDLQNYIIIHELCHTKIMNHSSLFWNEVGRFYPDYCAARKRLKDYAFLTRLYP